MGQVGHRVGPGAAVCPADIARRIDRPGSRPHRARGTRTRPCRQSACGARSVSRRPVCGTAGRYASSSQRTRIVQSPTGRDWRRGQALAALALAIRQPRASSQEVSTLPASNSKRQVPQPPTLHSCGRPTPARSARAAASPRRRRPRNDGPPSIWMRCRGTDRSSRGVTRPALCRNWRDASAACCRARRIRQGSAVCRATASAARGSHHHARTQPPMTSRFAGCSSASRTSSAAHRRCRCASRAARR